MKSQEEKSPEKDIAPNSDWELIRAFGAGRAGAADELAGRYYQKVLHTCARFFTSREDARDAAQEVFVKILGERKILQFRGESKFWTWLYRVVLNTCKTRLARHQKTAHINRLVCGVSWEAWDGPPAPQCSPEEEYSLRQARERLQGVLARLPKKYREIIRLICLEEYSYRDAARQLKIPIAHLGVQLMRGKNLLTKLHRLAWPEVGPA